MRCYLYSLLGAEITERVFEVFLYPSRQLGPLVRAAEALVREYHYTVVRFTTGNVYLNNQKINQNIII